MDTAIVSAQVESFLSDAWSFRDFVQWFNASLWNLDASEEPGVSDFAWAIESRLYERSKGMLDECGVRDAISADFVDFRALAGRQSAKMHART